MKAKKINHLQPKTSRIQKMVEIPFQMQDDVHCSCSDKKQLQHLLNGKSRVHLQEAELEKYQENREMVPCAIVHQKEMRTSLGRWFSSGASSRLPLIIVS